MTQETEDQIIEAMARAYCTAAGGDPDHVTPERIHGDKVVQNFDPSWKVDVRDAKAHRAAHLAMIATEALRLDQQGTWRRRSTVTSTLEWLFDKSGNLRLEDQSVRALIRSVPWFCVAKADLDRWDHGDDPETPQEPRDTP
jgi:hypothetical protein